MVHAVRNNVVYHKHSVAHFAMYIQINTWYKADELRILRRDQTATEMVHSGVY